MKNEGSIKKSISEPGFDELWDSLSHNQQRYAVAMLESASKKEAALQIGVEPNTVYNWPDDVDRVVDMLMENARSAAFAIIKSAAAKAAMVKRTGLDSGDERVRQDVSTEILDRVLGRATQRTEFVGEGGGPVVVAIGGLDPDEDI